MHWVSFVVGLILGAILGGAGMALWMLGNARLDDLP